MTKLGEYLGKKSVSKAEISRKTGLSTSRLYQLTNNESTILRADELYMIAVAIDVNPCDMLETLFGELREKMGR